MAPYRAWPMTLRAVSFAWRRAGRAGGGANDLVVQTDTCVSRPLEELEGWIGALYTEPDGGVALLMMDDRGGAARRPVSASCEIGDPDLEWPRGYTEDPTRPLIWGDTFAFVQVYDVDPLYDHPNPTEDLYYLENAQTRNTGDTGYY